MALLIGVIGLALSGISKGQQATSIEFTSGGFEYTSGGLRITIIDLGLLPGGSASSGLAINNQPTIVGLANDSNFALQRPFWDANTGAIVGMAENMNPASTAIPERMNDSREMAGTEMYGDNVYQGVYWSAAGQAFALPTMTGVEPFYGALHTKAHGINNLGQIVGTGKEAAPNYYTHAVLWPNKDTEAIDLGFLGQGIPLNYSTAYGINDSSHVVGNSAVGTLTRGFLWRNGQMVDLGALSGQVVSEAYAINNSGRIAGRSNFYPVTWEYDVANSSSAPTINQLPIPAGFFDGVPTAVNDFGDVVGYAGAPNIYSHAILWRNGVAIDLGIWPGGHYSVANGINDFGQIVGTGTVAGDNLDHALLWTVDGFPFQAVCLGDGSGTPCPCTNNGASGNGCANGTFGGGANLSGTGNASVSSDTVVLEAIQSTPNKPGLFFQGETALNGGLGILFGDGLLCAGTNVVRLQTVFANGSGSAQSSIQISTVGGVSPGQTLYYQWWYRDALLSPCGNLFNLSNGLEVTWTP